jgi:hypothetical protein
MNSKLWTAFFTGYTGALGFGFYNTYYTTRVMAEHNAKLKRQWEDKLNKGNQLKNMEKGKWGA